MGDEGIIMTKEEQLLQQAIFQMSETNAKMDKLILLMKKMLEKLGE